MDFSTHISLLLVLSMLKVVSWCGNKTLQTNSSNISGAFKERITQLIENGLIEFTIPDKPKSPNQKYRLTELGKTILKQKQ